MPTQDEKERVKKGIRARQKALKTLIARHQEEFDSLHAQFRVEEGLPVRSSGPTATELQDRIKRQEERLKKWKDDLKRALGEDPLTE